MKLVSEEAHRERSLFFSPASNPRNLFDSVRRRVLLMAFLAMVPIAALGMIQGVMQLNGARDEARQRLLQRAVSAAATEANIIASAQSVLETLKTVDDVRNGGPECQATLNGARLSLPFASNLAVVDKNGNVACIAIPGMPSVANRQWWQSAKTSRADFFLSERLVSSATHTQVVAAVIPLAQGDIASGGAIVMSLDVRWLDELLKAETTPTEGIVAVFDARGKELISNSRVMSAALYAGRSVTPTGKALREATDEEGRSWTYAVAPLGRDDLVAAFALPTEELYGWTLLAVAASFALPVLVVIVSLIGLWYAVDQVVLQWLVYLRRVTTVYAQGHYGFRPTRLDAAPSEFRILGQAVENMALAVRLRDAKLRDALAEKTGMVREIHHRIKNSLQVVVSLLSLYGSGVSDPGDRRRFEQLRTRVNTLAVVHRLLYEANEGSTVRLRELLHELAALLEGVPDRDLFVKVEAPDLLLPTDRAAPFALMMVELVLSLTPPGPGRRANITLVCGLQAGHLFLTVGAPLPPDDCDLGDHDGLAQGFASQLGGQLTRIPQGDTIHVHGEFPWSCARKDAPTETGAEAGTRQD